MKHEADILYCRGGEIVFGGRTFEELKLIDILGAVAAKQNYNPGTNKSTKQNSSAERERET